MKKKDLFPAAMQEFPGNFCWKNLQGEYINCNENFINLFKLKSIEALIGKKDEELWGNSDEIKTIKKNDNKVINSGRTLYAEETITLKKGKSFYLAVIKAPFQSKDGRIVGIICNLLDISHLKNNHFILIEEKNRADALSKQIQHYLETIVDSLPGSIYWKNKNSMYVGCNSFMVQTAGLKSSSEIIGKTGSFKEFVGKLWGFF